MDHLKKAVAVMLAAASISSCAVAAYAADFKKGDYNKDGVVDASDALLTLQASVYSEYLSKEKKELADFNSDGSVDASDALQILLTSVSSSSSRQSVTQPSVQKLSNIKKTSTQVADMAGWNSADVVAKVGPLFTEDQRKTGILASVSMAQFIVESGYGQSDIAINANNCFGIKGYPDGSVYTDSPWDGVSVYAVSTREYDYYGNAYYEDAYFRKYACMEDSIEDHSRVLLTSTDGSRLRYASVVGVTDYRRACQIIYDGGYCTDPSYVDLLCDVIEYWGLTKYDLANSGYYPSGSVDDSVDVETVEEDTAESNEIDNTDDIENIENIENVTPRTLYRVRTDWDDIYSEIGAFNFIENAEECAKLNEGYNVYDESGNIVYSSAY